MNDEQRCATCVWYRPTCCAWDGECGRWEGENPPFWTHSVGSDAESVLRVTVEHGCREWVELPAADRHTLARLHHGLVGWAARCRCGWRAEWPRTEAAARQAHADHAAEAQK